MTFLFLTLVILANYRLARLITKDMISEPFRRWLGKKAAGRNFIWLHTAELFHCPYCLGVWTAQIFALFFATSLLDWILLTLAIAGGQTFLQGLTDD